MIFSNIVSRVSALVLLVAGLAQLFVPDVIMPAIVTGFPPSGVWLGQVLGAAFLGFAALDWLSRDAILGGIYGRPVVAANSVLYFVSTLTLVRAATRSTAPLTLIGIAVPAAALTLAYGVLLYRGPFDSRVGESTGR